MKRLESSGGTGDGRGDVAGSESPQAAKIFRLYTLSEFQGPRGNRIPVPIRRVVRSGPEAVHKSGVSFEIVTAGRTPEEITQEVRKKWSGLKRERGELSGIFIGEAWPYVTAVRRELIEKGRASGAHSGVGQDPKGYGRELVPLDPQKEGGYEKEELKAAMRSTLRTGTGRWSDWRKPRLQEVPPEEWTEKDQKYADFTDITAFGKKWWLLADSDPEMLISTGVGMALNTTWSLFDVAEELLIEQRKAERKEGKSDGTIGGDEAGIRATITQAEMEALYKATLPVTIKLAAGHVDLIAPFVKFLRGRPFRANILDTPFQKKYFTLTEKPVPGSTKKKYELEITEDAIRAFEQAMIKDADPTRAQDVQKLSSVTTMCPALGVDGGGNPHVGLGEPDSNVRDVVMETHQWCVDVAKEYYLPSRFPREVAPIQ